MTDKTLFEVTYEGDVYEILTVPSNATHLLILGNDDKLFSANRNDVYNVYGIKTVELTYAEIEVMVDNTIIALLAKNLIEYSYREYIYMWTPEAIELGYADMFLARPVRTATECITRGITLIDAVMPPSPEEVDKYNRILGTAL